MRTVNPFKEKLLSGEPQFGLFSMSLTAQTAEALSGSGFDFLMFDIEHTPTSLPTLYSQALALAPTPTQCLVRMPSADPVLFKPVLDMAIDTVMVPNIRTAEEAQAAVRAVRYPPHGIRGVGGSVRATGYGRHGGYYAAAAERVCLLLQLESAQALANLESICAVDGVDGLFVGPVDLATDMGYIAQPLHPEVVAAAVGAVRRILAGEAQAQRYVADALAARWVRAPSN
jgi:4-hydroxy-2-oxoheptanedioate aldolase